MRMGDVVPDSERCWEGVAVISVSTVRLLQWNIISRPDDLCCG